MCLDKMLDVVAGETKTEKAGGAVGNVRDYLEPDFWGQGAGNTVAGRPRRVDRTHCGCEKLLWGLQESLEGICIACRHRNGLERVGSLRSYLDGCTLVGGAAWLYIIAASRHMGCEGPLSPLHMA